MKKSGIRIIRQQLSMALPAVRCKIGAILECGTYYPRPPPQKITLPETATFSAFVNEDTITMIDGKASLRAFLGFSRNEENSWFQAHFLGLPLEASSAAG
jgi:hypothetical protein